MSLFKKKAPKAYYSSSEFVSSGHPDRVADNIAAALIEAIQQKDGVNSHAAIEVFLTHDTCYISGEATTTLDLSKEFLSFIVEIGFLRSGYLPDMRKYWTKKEVMLANDLKIVNKICKQSPDIALGTTDKGEDSGWNDQGVYFSSAENTNPLMLGTPHYLAMKISNALTDFSRKSILAGYDTSLPPEYLPPILGPDNKVVVTVKVGEDGYTPLAVTAVTIAVAHSSYSSVELVQRAARAEAMKVLRKAGIPVVSDCQWVINGTGRFVIHGCVSDTSMTGRKISVNHPSAGPVWCNKMIGGGSLVKPAHASDLMLNIMSRYIAEVVVAARLSKWAVVGCAGAIGQHGLQSIFIKGDAEFEKRKDIDKIYAFFNTFVEWTPIAIAKKFGFFNDDFDFGEAVNDNFFGNPITQPWENPANIYYDADSLLTYLSVK